VERRAGGCPHDRPQLASARGAVGKAEPVGRSEDRQKLGPTPHGEVARNQRIDPRAGTGVVRRMAQIGVTVTRAVEQPSPRVVTAEEAALLGVQKGTLATHIQRTYYAEDGRPVETSDIVVPANLCEVVYEVPVNP
jgi:hypothetical protein